MFRRRKTRQARQGHPRPLIEPEEPLALNLPSENDFRVSLLLPSLSERFQLLREPNGALVSYEKMSKALRRQRETGLLDSSEEEALLYQFQLQAAKERAPRPPSPEEMLAPTTLQDFHRLRATSQGSSLFGHTARREPVAQSPSSDTSKHKPVRTQRSAPTSPLQASNGTEPSYFDLYSSDDGASPAPHRVRSADHVKALAAQERQTPKSNALPPRRPQRPQLTSEQINRLSRVIDDLGKDLSLGHHVTSSTASATIAEEDAEETIDALLNSHPIPLRTSSIRRLSDSTNSVPSQKFLEPLPAQQNAPEPISAKTPNLDELSQAFPRSPSSFPESPLGALEPPHEITPRQPVSKEAYGLETPDQIFKTMFPSPDPEVNFDHDAPQMEAIATPPTTPPRAPGHSASTSETTDLSTAPSGIHSLAYNSLNRSTASLTSDGSSYCPDLGYESDHPLDAKTTRDPFEFDALVDGPSLEASAEADLLSARDDVLHGLNIHDLALIQKELVRTASQRGQPYAEESIEEIPETEASARTLPAKEEVAAGEAEEEPLADTAEARQLKTSNKSLEDLPTPSLMGSNASPSASVDSHPSYPTTPIDVLAPNNALPDKGASLDAAAPLEIETPRAPSREVANEAEATSVNQDQKSARSNPVHPAAMLRAQPTARSTTKPANTQSVLIRDVAEQAAAATAALKSSRSPSLNRRKSSKSLKGNISAPHLLSSSAKLNNLVNVSAEETDHTTKHVGKTSSSGGLRHKMLKRFDSKPNLPSAADEITPFNLAEVSKGSTSGSNMLTSPDLSAQAPSAFSPHASPTSPQDRSPRMERSGSTGSTNGDATSVRNRLLSKFRKRKDSQDGLRSPPHGPGFSPPVPSKTRSFSPPPLPITNRSFSPPTLSTSNRSFSPPLPLPTTSPSLDSPPELSASLPLTAPTSSSNSTAVSEGDKGTVGPLPSPLPSASRAPVSYDVGSRRRRTGSASAETASIPPVPPSPSYSQVSVNRKIATALRDSWVPLDPEVAAASWRDSRDLDGPSQSDDSAQNKHDTTEQSLQKLREAAEALGLDSSKVDQLVDEARKSSMSPTSMPKIDEEDSTVSDNQLNFMQEPSVVRRTVILASDALSIVPSRSSSLRRSLILGEVPVTKRASHRRKESAKVAGEGDGPFEGPVPISPLRSVKDRAPTPPPIKTQHRRTRSNASATNLRTPPLPQSPLFPSHSANDALAPVPSLSATLEEDLDRASEGDLERTPTQTQGEVVIASGRLTASGNGGQPSAPPPIAPGDRLEIDEMSDASLIWQVVRDLRRASTVSVASDWNIGGHSRQSSQDSARTPPTLSRSVFGSPGSPSRSVLSPEKLKMVVSKNKHRRMQSAERGVGNLTYIKSPPLSNSAYEDADDDDCDTVDVPASSETHNRYRSLQVYEADDNVVTALIEDLTSAMDHGAFSLERQNSINRLKMATRERSVRGLQIRPRPPQVF